MFVTMAIAALLVDRAFDLAGVVPEHQRPSRADVFGRVAVDYKLVLNLVGLAIFATLFALTMRRDAEPSMHH
jgi:hypothetical protein